MSKANYVPPAVEKAAVPVVTTPTGAGQSVGHPSKPGGKSNFDLTGRRIVKRGNLVSWHGLRFKVSRVRMGTLYVDQSTLVFSDPADYFPLRYLPCSSVQVVR